MNVQREDVSRQSCENILSWRLTAIKAAKGVSWHFLATSIYSPFWRFLLEVYKEDVKEQWHKRTMYNTPVHDNGNKRLEASDCGVGFCYVLYILSEEAIMDYGC